MLISLTSCSQSKKTRIIPNYCILYTPLPNDLTKDVINYWINQQLIIDSKSQSGEPLSPEEKFNKILIGQIGSNDKKYYDKECDKL